MTPEQFDRWRDFALRMARTCFKGKRKPGPKWIAEKVQWFFDLLDADDIPCLVDWDNSDPYPEGHQHRSLERASACYFCSGRSPQSQHCKHCRGTGRYEHWAAPDCVGDMLLNCSEEIIPDYWSIPDAKYDDVAERWQGPVTICLRAGLDLASAPSAGVVGFTVGDLRAMYPEGVPGWLKEGWVHGSPLDKKQSRKPKPTVFDQLPDTTPLWM